MIHFHAPIKVPSRNREKQKQRKLLAQDELRSKEVVRRVMCARDFLQRNLILNPTHCQYICCTMYVLEKGQDIVLYTK